MLRWLRRLRRRPVARSNRAVAASIRNERRVLERWARRSRDPHSLP